MEKQIYSLSEPQNRVWLTQMLHKDSSLYNIGGYVLFDGYIDIRKLKESIKLCINKYSALRIKIVQREERYYQYFDDTYDVDIGTLDFSPEDNAEKSFEAWCNNELSIPFVLENQFLFEFAAAKLEENKYGYFIKLHHVIADGWSIQLLTDEVLSRYDRLLNGTIKDEGNAETASDYRDYIEMEKRYLCSERFYKNKLFWKHKLDNLRNGCAYGFSKQLDGARKSFFISAEKSDRIRDFCRLYGISINALFTALYLVCQYTKAQKKDFVIGIPFLGRASRKELQIFGMLVSSIPFPFSVLEEETIPDMAGRIDSELMPCFLNSRYPYNYMLKDTGSGHQTQAGLFDSCVNYYNTNMKRHYGDIRITNKELYCGQQDFALQLIIRDWSGGALQADIDYKLSLFRESVIEDLFHKLEYSMDLILKSQDIRVQDCCNRLREEERNKLVNVYNQTDAFYPADKTVIDLFREQVAQNPNNRAVFDKRRYLTYGQLHEKAGCLAAVLRSRGVERNSVVGLIANHSIEAIIGILAILMSGGAFLCIDPKYPLKRKQFMLRDSQVSLLLTNIDDQKAELSEAENIQIMDLREEYRYGEAAVHSGNTETDLNDLAYVLYTSGTSGKPKGVMIEHHGLLRYIYWANKMYVGKKPGSFAFFTSLSFDLTITSIFTPLIGGNQIIIYDEDNGTYVLNRIISDNLANIIKVTPTHLSLLDSRKRYASKINTIIVGGEQLTVKLAKQIYDSFGGDVDIYNEYGPTETVVGCMIHKYNPEEDINDVVPIGRPADNVRIYILDGQLRPVSLNTAGNLYISGANLSRGYMNNELLTKQKFLADPFTEGRKMYAAGDLARYINYHCIEYIGRADDQVKINGFRIEPDEIRNSLLKHTAVRDAIITVGEDEGGNKFICAYVVKQDEISGNDLKVLLLEYLPQYMIPNLFIEIDKIPMTVTGKIDKAGLPKPDLAVTACNNNRILCDDRLAVCKQTLSEVLMVHELDENSDFYQLGGDSVKAIMISTKISNQGYRLKASDILTNPKVGDMALMLEAAKNSHGQSCRGDISPTPMFVYFQSMNLKNADHYNQSVILSVDQRISVRHLQKAFDYLISYHDTLRINYDSKNNTLFYNDRHLQRQIGIPVYNIKPMPASDKQIYIYKICGKMKTGFHIEDSLLLKACLFAISDKETLLFITAHHLIIDGISWSIIINDLNTLLEQLLNQKMTLLPEKSASCKEWADYVSGFQFLQSRLPASYQTMQERVGSQSAGFGKSYLDNYKNCGTAAVKLSEEQSGIMLGIIKSRRDISEIDILVYAISEAFREVFHWTGFLIDMEWHGREWGLNKTDLSRTVGWFTSIAPLYVELSCSDIDEALNHRKAQVDESRLLAQNYEFLYWYYKNREQHKSVLKLNYLGNYDSVFQNSLLKYADYDTGEDIGAANFMENPFELNAIIVNSRMNISITYSKRIIASPVMKQLTAAMLKNVDIILKHLIKNDNKYMLPSDFSTADITCEELNSLFS
jgi:amino acid adenylation domain-containing protein/non-ribosomal peptide synthase protein (TIGR01720 family)